MPHVLMTPCFMKGKNSQISLCLPDVTEELPGLCSTLLPVLFGRKVSQVHLPDWLYLAQTCYSRPEFMLEHKL